MGKLDAIASIAGIGAAVYIFLQAKPYLDQLFGGGGQQVMTAFGPVESYDRPPPIPPIDVEAEISKLAAASNIPGTPIGVDNASNAVQVTSPGLIAAPVSALDAPILQVPNSTPLGIGLTPPKPALVHVEAAPAVSYVEAAPAVSYVEAAPAVSYQSGGQPTSGTYWINPTTQGVIAPYVPGKTPQEVLDLRKQDIFPAIRGF